MTWTTEKPTEYGYYWVHIKGAQEPFIAEYDPSNTGYGEDYPFYTPDESWDFDELKHWAGPIPLPESA